MNDREIKTTFDNSPAERRLLKINYATKPEIRVNTKKIRKRVKRYLKSLLKTT